MRTRIPSVSEEKLEDICMRCETENYQGFLQQAVRLLGLGYYHYRLTEYPMKKRDRWPEIDARITEKYSVVLALSKFQRARRKRDGLLNAQFFRFDRWALLMVSDGLDDCGILRAESPSDARRAPIRFSATRTLTFQIHRLDGHFTTSLERSCFRDLVAYYQEAGKKADLESIKTEFWGLDCAIPSWSGIYDQKARLRQEILSAARVAGRKWEAKDFHVSRLKRSVKVFKK